MQQLDKVYVKEIVRLHGVPLSIISYCGTQFTSKVWGKLHDELGTQLAFSTTFHPQMDGQLERTIKVLRTCWGYVWITLEEIGWILPLCEFSYRNNYHYKIYMIPCESLYERGYRSPIVWFEAGDVTPLGVDLVKDDEE